MDWLNFFVKLAEALFEAFGKAVTDYALTTPLVFAGVFYFLYVNPYFIFWKDGKFKKKYTAMELLFALVGFITSTVLANFVGYIFNFFVGVIGKLLNFSDFHGCLQSEAARISRISYFILRDCGICANEEVAMEI